MAKTTNTKASTIIDQFGQPIDRSVLDEPQTARIASLENQYLTPMLSGLTPARLARILQEADNGNLLEQHRLFADMEERDAHLRAEMDKRKSALASLDWDIVEPRNASAAEKAATEWVREVLTDAVDPVEDLLLALMEGVGHGFAPVELEWRQDGGELLPAFHPRPQEWFRLNVARTELRLRDVSVDGAPLLPFGWVMHTNGKAKTGYAGRMGLHRTLSWPWLYKAYSLGDFAEYLETYGLPMIVGKYFSGASADEKASLMRAVTALGHDARAIMPQEMTLEIQKIAGGGSSGDTPHMAMIQWAEKAESKAILGQTLSADTGSKGGGSYALGKVHEEVRHDILRGDARQIAGTLTRDLVYPLIALNKGGIDGLRRCPQFRFDLGEMEDLIAYADALPKLVGVGFKVPRPWAQEKLHIPEPQEGEDVLQTSSPSGQDTPPTPQPPLRGGGAVKPSAALAALSAVPSPSFDAAQQVIESGVDATLSLVKSPIAAALIRDAIASATSPADLDVKLAALLAGMDDVEYRSVLERALFAAEMLGYLHAE